MYRQTHSFLYAIIAALLLFTTAQPAATEENILEKLSNRFDKLPCFGYDFFLNSKDEPIVKMPLSDEYLIKPKDEFVILIQSDGINHRYDNYPDRLPET